jgi:DNA-binding XRE family transcriptional regulator
MSSMKMILPILLKKHRKNAGLTQREAAGEAKISLQTYKSYEAGRRVPSLEMATRIADALGITLDELVGR